MKYGERQPFKVCEFAEFPINFDIRFDNVKNFINQPIFTYWRVQSQQMGVYPMWRANV